MKRGMVRSDPMEAIMAKAKSQPKLSGAKPTMRLYSVNGDGPEAFWLQVGAAWPHRDGKGLTIQCDAVPLRGRLVLRTISLREQIEGPS